LSALIENPLPENAVEKGIHHLPAGDGPEVFELRVLILAPFGHDGKLTLELIQSARFAGEVCRGVFDLCHKIEQGCGAVVVAEEALATSSLSVLIDCLRDQPSWSDLPLVVVTSSGDETVQSRRVLQAFGATAHLAMIERPFRRSTLLTALDVAMRSRKRQYAVRDLLAEQARIARSLANSEESLRMAMESTQLGTWDYYPPSGKLHWSARCKELFGLPPNAPVDYQTFLDGLHPADRARVNEQLQATLRDGNQVFFEAEYRTVGLQDGGVERWIRASGRSHFGMFEGKRTVVRFVGTVQDITRRRKTEEALRAANENLEREVLARTAKLQETVGELEAFSYSITHDMRAPLRAMQGFAIALEEESGSLAAESRDYVRRIVNSANRMDQLITDVLNYSRSLRADVPLRVLDFAVLTRGILESYPQFQSSTVRVELDGPFPKVLANEAALTQCISNLLNNAVKFVAPGAQPRVRIWAEPKERTTRFWFEDNGIGIKPEFRDKIWGLFQKLHRGYEGTGLGLAIVRKAVDRMGGSVGVESEPGKGSRFWLELQRPPS
jgi:PAS domain S-box-containing protein